MTSPTPPPTPGLSIIVPVYNAARHLAATLDSVLRQTRTDWELIMVDDGSSDESCAIAAAYCTDARITLLRQANQGPAAARNTGRQHARADLIAFLDADDEWEPAYLATLAQALERAPTAVLALAGWQYMDGSGARLPQRVVIAPEQVAQVRRDLPYRNPLVPSGVVVARRALEAAGGFDPDLFGVEDWDLWLRLCPLGEFVAVPEVLVGYRTLPESVSDNIERMARERGKLHDKHLAPGPQRDLAAAYTLFDTALAYLRAGQARPALARLQEAVRQQRTLVDLPEFYYELACAYQPRGYRGSAVGLRLPESARLLHDLLWHQLPLRPSARQPAWGQACRVLAELALHAGQRTAARAYARQALRYATRTNRGTAARVWLRAGLPPSLVRALRAARRR